MFDLDGTLLDTEPFYRAAFDAAAHAFGVVVPPDLYRGLVGIATSERRPILRHAFGARFPVDEFIATYYAQRAAHVPRRIPLCPGAASLLHRLRVPQAVATSASRRTAFSHLGRAGLEIQFRHVVTRDDVPRGKPAPDTFLRAAELLGVAPAECIAVEDSGTGVAAAHAAGMGVVMVAPHATNETRDCCLAVVSRLDAIADLLGPAAVLPKPCSTFIRWDGDAEERPVTHTS